jgi:hypothetical protein
MVLGSRSRSATREGKLLDRLVKAQGLKRYAFFFVSGEDDLLPNGIETASGFVIDDQGCVFSFWTGWDTDRNQPTFTEWEQLEPEDGWLSSGEYREARQQVGLKSGLPS